jgi:hypothetical protein
MNCASAQKFALPIPKPVTATISSGSTDAFEGATNQGAAA